VLLTHFRGDSAAASLKHVTAAVGGYGSMISAAIPPRPH